MMDKFKKNTKINVSALINDKLKLEHLMPRYKFYEFVRNKKFENKKINFVTRRYSSEIYHYSSKAARNAWKLMLIFKHDLSRKNNCISVLIS